ncbi:hypothetical protein P4H70_04515 [Paenibacillus ehimensis]|uniref:hypothetical protein n=1 Tax=Paenibacillus ehimensis TaxID=79264 RepID=UPI002DBA6C84|nr:hypothetical protein [Paenibacillus ehimensis]MEC0208204.1 hypothetical protein [Paenibacillus ehimensis]
MNNHQQQFQLPAATNGSKVELHPHPAVSITTVVVLQHTTVPDASRKLVCESESRNEPFEIVVFKDAPFSGLRFKFRFIRETIEQLSGWKVYLFKMYSPGAVSGGMFADRQTKELYIDADLLRMPLRAIAKLIGSLPDLLSALSERVKSAVDGLYKSGRTKTFRVNQQTSVGLTVSENGLCLPSHYVFSADELFVHVSINDNEVYLRFDNGWRMFFQTQLPLPFYAYKTPIEVRSQGYTIPLPLDVCYELKRDPQVLRFMVYAD